MNYDKIGEHLGTSYVTGNCPTCKGTGHVLAGEWDGRDPQEQPDVIDCPACQDGPVIIPSDGKDHPCLCGKADYRADDCFGFAPELRVVDVEGRPVSYCHHCERELEARA